MTEESASPEQPRQVYAPEDWRTIAQAPLPAIPGATSVMCAAIKDNGDPCKNKAMYGVPFCLHHGGGTITTQEQAKRRIDLVRSQLFTKLVAAAEEAADTLITVMRTGKRDADRIAAADRVFRLLGFDESVSQVPGATGPTDEELSDIDTQLVGLLTTVARDQLVQAIEVTATDEEVSDDEADVAAAAFADGARSVTGEGSAPGAEPDAGSEDGVEVEAPSA